MILAQAAAPAAPSAAPENPLGALSTFLLPIGFMLVIFYILLIRPQKKQEKARKDMINALKKNDKVVTIGGIHGIVANVRDKDVTLKIDESGDVRIRVSRSAVSRVITKDADDEE
ncbi:MAG: preprotein translocase subunit YajC [Planctomycetes bacterium]|nr:preprotein translocase subunit YajC [Planctomycetota bacterium]